jgi:hypothetical protein
VNTTLAQAARLRDGHENSDTIVTSAFLHEPLFENNFMEKIMLITVFKMWEPVGDVE